MICWHCHGNSVNTGSRLPICSDIKTRKRRNVVGIDMIRNNRIVLLYLTLQVFLCTWINFYGLFVVFFSNSQHAHLPSAEGFYPQNRPCIPKIVGTFYMQGYKVKEKTAIVPHCTPSFKTQWAPWFKSTWDNSFNIIEHLYLFSVYKVIFGFCSFDNEL
jgi:hypothetical protein